MESAERLNQDLQNAKMNKDKNPVMRKKKISLGVLIAGIVALIAGAVVLIINLTAKPAVRDAEYLVQVKSWVREDAPTVEWTFTEIGKGSLTTDEHLNDYNFTWALEGDKMKIETEWLYTLNHNLTYTLDQSNNKLTLTNDTETVTFVPKVTE